MSESAVHLERLATQAIIAAATVYNEPQFKDWADSWVFESDRSENGAETARARAWAVKVWLASIGDREASQAAMAGVLAASCASQAAKWRDSPTMSGGEMVEGLSKLTAMKVMEIRGAERKTSTISEVVPEEIGD